MVNEYVTGDSVTIGRQGENEAHSIWFDITELKENYGDGTAILVHMRPSDQAPYICETQRFSEYVQWKTTSTDTAYAGKGQCELRWIVGDVLAKSQIYTTVIIPSITVDSVIPAPYESWYESLMDAIQDMAIDQSQIDTINAKIKYVNVLSRSSVAYQTDELALAALDEYATERGTGRYTGYINDFNSSVMGLPLITHYYDLYVNNSGYRLLVAYSSDAGKIYLRAKVEGNWQSGWTEMAEQSDVQNLTALTQGRQYGSLASLYTELIALLSTNQEVWCTATGSLVSTLTNGGTTYVCRVAVIKADETVLDYMLFAPGAGQIYTGRIRGTVASSVTNITKFTPQS